MISFALAQVNAVVGDVEGNAALIRARVAQAAEAGVSLVAFPEMVLTGYPVEDLALRPSFQDASVSAIHALAADLATDGFGELTVIVGYLDHGPLNAAAVIRDGRVAGRYAKHHLPNYGVFDEARYFHSGDSPLIVDVDGEQIAIAICEDLWQDGGPVQWARNAAADLLVVINGSPYEVEKDDVRLELCARRAREASCPLAYVNLVGGQDELVFDGDSLVVSAEGELIARSPQFVEDLLIIGPTVEPSVATRMSDEEEMYTALTVGLRDYVEKNGFTSVLIGLSGGIDSALVAAIACDAIGGQRVYGVSLPSKYSSEHSKDDAHDLASRAGCHIRTVPIEPMVNAYHQSLHLTGLAEENLQARVRGTTLMAISNQEGHLVLATGNKSELAVGYSTIYGDAVGGFAPIKDVVKTQVWALSNWRNARAVELGQTPPIPPNSITKPPSAELRPDQLDTDSLPEYELLDRLLMDYVGRDNSFADLVGRGHNPELVERVLRLVDVAEYKRRQYPPGTKITFKAFGRDRRLPITNRWRERP